MNRKLFYTLGALVLMLSMILAACAPAATEAPAAEEPAAEEPAAEEPAAEEPAATEEVVEEPAETEEPVEEEAMEPELFWNQAERQAVAAALDREALVDRTSEGRNIPAYHMVPTGYPYA